MNLPEFDTTPQPLDIPDKCLRCPTISAINKEYVLAQKFQAFARTMGESVMDGMPEDIRSNFIDHLYGTHGVDLAAQGESAEEVVEAIEMHTRTSASKILEVADEAVEATAKLAEGIIAACHDGSIKMRASRGKAEFTVRICTSTEPNSHSNAADVTRTTI